MEIPTETRYSYDSYLGAKPLLTTPFPSRGNIIRFHARDGFEVVQFADSPGSLPASNVRTAAFPLPKSVLSAAGGLTIVSALKNVVARLLVRHPTKTHGFCLGSAPLRKPLASKQLWHLRLCRRPLQPRSGMCVQPFAGRVVVTSSC